MNDTSPAGSASTESLLPSGIDAITTLHFAFMALVALLAIGILVYGIRRRRRRDRATEQVEENADAAGIPAAEETDETGPRADAAPAPVTPAPVTPVPLDEPIAAAAPLDSTPATLAADAPAAPARPAASSADGPVTQLKGLGPKVAARLAELGITTVGQLAALSDDRAEALDADLGPFRGRLARDRWIEQARLLAAGDRPGFEAVFGRL